MVPTALALLEELPQTSHGKVDRQALASRRLITRSTAEKYIAPRDAIELQLVHLWEKLLGASPIGVTENFFQLGGHSLAGVRLMSQIQR
ncbi:MAG: phosphopantetheine-binding protein, partial [Ktedonobacteraceae bacterium]